MLCGRLYTEKGRPFIILSKQTQWNECVKFCVLCSEAFQHFFHPFVKSVGRPCKKVAIFGENIEKYLQKNLVVSEIFCIFVA